MVQNDSTVLEAVTKWVETWNRQAFVSAYGPSNVPWACKEVIVILYPAESSPDCTKEVLAPLTDHIQTALKSSLIRIAVSHASVFVSVSGDAMESLIFAGCVPASVALREDGLGRYVTAKENGLLLSRDTVTMRALLLPRLYHWAGLFTESAGSAFSDAVSLILRWADRRKVRSDSDTGFLTTEMVAVMMAHCHQTLVDSESVLTPHAYMKRFFALFSQWSFNETSVAAQCCGPAGVDGGAIDEHEGIDSDLDEESRARRIRANGDRPERASLTETADDNDEVHPHKRQRHELGQIRDVRRFFDVENSKVAKISVNGESFESKLDYLDAVTIVHPVDDVNLAVRILESHKKIIQQELQLAHMLTADSVGDDLSFLTSDSSRLMTPVPFRESSCYIVLQVEAESKEACSTIASVLDDQAWYLVQEIQAFHGVHVTPHPRPFFHSTDAGTTTGSVIVGVSFVSDYPYGAFEGVSVDFSGPLSRALVRSRQKIRERPDFSSLERKFSVNCALLQSLPQHWKLE